MLRRSKMMNMLMAASVAALFATTVQAQNKMSAQSKMSGQGKMATVSAADKKFAMAAAQGGMAEVQLGELASKQGSSGKVKEFGQKMVEDHGKANDDLKSVASSKSLTLPAAPNAKQKALMARLMKLHGAAFDSAYIKAMKEDHKMDIADFKKESTSGQDSEIKGFATRTLPVVEGHYQMLMKM